MPTPMATTSPIMALAVTVGACAGSPVRAPVRPERDGWFASAARHPDLRFGCTLGGTMGNGREPQVILKTDERNLVLELGARGNSSAGQSLGYFLDGGKLEIAVKSGLGR
jgi:hypothetical protein